LTIDPAVILGFITALTGALSAVARFVYLDLRRDRDYWRSVALKSMGHTDKALDVVVSKDG
jgi:hypothetical protein